MTTAYLLHDLIDQAAACNPAGEALVHRNAGTSYAALAAMQDGFAAGVLAHAAPGARIGLWLTKSSAMVAAAFGAAKAGAAFVPINPMLKPPQVGHILDDCAVEILVTSPDRFAQIAPRLASCTSVRMVVLLPDAADCAIATTRVIGWGDFCGAPPSPFPRLGPEDVAAIFYTSGSTGKPKGVVVPHRSLVTGARSVADYLDQRSDDRVLGVMPLSFDAGFSQLTTAFLIGATCVLMDYLHPAEVLRALDRHKITGMTGVPALWAQLAELDWPPAATARLRYWATTGGRMPQAVLGRLRTIAPAARPYLMYGLTEAFRSTYLPPDEIDAKPGSIGRAIPGQSVDVRRPDGTVCAPGEIGQLVHRGSTITLGYWNNPPATEERFGWIASARPEVALHERAVFSGDQARMDDDGYIYFIGRTDEMIKSSGHRISPVEIEEVVHASGLVEECAAFGIEDAAIGQRIGLAVFARAGTSIAEIRQACRAVLPGHMIPHDIDPRDTALPRNPNGKIDRRAIAQAWTAKQQEQAA